METNSLNSVQVLFQKAYVEALISNQQQVEKWMNYKRDVVDVQDRLILFLNDLNVPVMIPIGNKALFRGKLVHTNDITISLGDGYFVKGSVQQALEIISRRIIKCDEMLHKLAKERTLLESRTNLTKDKDLFPTEDTKEIIEDFNEEEEEKWREKHRLKVKEYKQKISSMKEQEPQQIKSDEDLFKRLELLEMEEELNDELDRLGVELESSEYSEEDSSDEKESIEEPVVNNTIVEHPGYNKAPKSSIIKKPQNNITSETKIDKNELVNQNKEPGDNDYIKIEFKHSSYKPEVKESDNGINSPYDIYKKFDNKKEKLSRRVSFADAPEVKTFKQEPIVFTEHPKSVEDVPVAFGDVVERIVTTDSMVTERRPVSKFKSSRSQQKSS